MCGELGHNKTRCKVGNQGTLASNSTENSQSKKRSNRQRKTNRESDVYDYDVIGVTIKRLN